MGLQLNDFAYYSMQWLPARLYWFYNLSKGRCRIALDYLRLGRH